MENFIKKMLREGLENQTGLSPQEENILNDLLSETLEENIDIQTLLSKFKKYAKQGAITAGIVMSLMSSDAIGQEQKEVILNTAKQEMSSDEVDKMQQVLKKDTGLEFNKDFVGSTFTSVEDSKPFDLPTDMEIKAQIVRAGLPAKFLDNIYVNYVENAQGNDHAGVMISIRMSKDNFNRLAQPEMRRKVQKLVYNALKGYKNTLKNAKGEAVVINIEVLDPNGSIIGGKPMQIKG